MKILCHELDAILCQYSIRCKKQIIFFENFRIGPLVRHWTMRYEAKHQQFKQLSCIIGNYINICHTLAERHQMCQCHWLSSEGTYNIQLEVGSGE